MMLLSTLTANAQSVKDKPVAKKFKYTGKYFSFNPMGFVEPQLALGLGFGNRLSERNEYFTELSYLSKYHLYGNLEKSFRGERFLAQYRYHLLEQWGQMTGRAFHRKARRTSNFFIGAEFRLKAYHFSDNNDFANAATHDTLRNVLYSARALSVGGAFVFGTTVNLGSNGKWKLEYTAGLGVKQKFVQFTDKPSGYDPLIVRRIDVGAPYLFEAVSMPYVPCTIRLRYIIR